MAAPFARFRRVLLCILLATCAAASLTAITPARASASQTVAVQAHLLWSQYDAADRERLLDRAQEAGAGMVRVDLGWASLEQEGKGEYSKWYLGKVDHVVAEAEERGIEVLFTFWETPCWASTAPESLKQGCEGAWWDRAVQRYPPADAGDYAEALAFMVRRYGDRVAAWELWNEPNHPHYFKAADQVGSYAELVKAAYPVAKAADPDATIIAGSLADADFEFTRALLDRGVGGSFDAWSVHPYSEDRSPLHPGIPGWTKKSFAAGVPAVRDTLLAHGQDTPIWLTEFGWSTCSVRGDRAAYHNCVDPSTQAEWLREAFLYMRTWDYVPVGVSYNLEDTSDDAGDRVENYGLMSHDGTPKPAFAAFRAVADLIHSGTPVPPAVASAGSPAPAPGAAPARGESSPSRTVTPAGPTPRETPSPAPRTERRSAAARSVTLKARRRGVRVSVEGVLSWGRTLHVRAYRWKPRERRFSRETSYRALIAVGPDGRFRHDIAAKALARGRWLIVVKGRRRPQLQAEAVVGRRSAGAASGSRRGRARRP